MDYRKQIDEIVDLILKQDASDLHLSAGRNPIIRVSGSLIPLLKRAIITPQDMQGFIDVFLTKEKQNMK